MTSSVNATLSSLTSSIGNRTAQDRKDITALDKSLQAKKAALSAAIMGGDEGQILLAKQEFEHEAQKLNAKSEMLSVINKIINQVIEKIGQIGR